jgi:hypothetical protein
MLTGMSSLNEIEALRAAEEKLLAKFTERAAVLQRQDPRLSHACALGRACAEMPRTYEKFSELRERMIALRMKPTLVK